MKRVFAVALAALLVFGLAAPVSAEVSQIWNPERYQEEYEAALTSPIRPAIPSTYRYTAVFTYSSYLFFVCMEKPEFQEGDTVYIQQYIHRMSNGLPLWTSVEFTNTRLSIHEQQNLIWLWGTPHEKTLGHYLADVSTGTFADLYAVYARKPDLIRYLYAPVEEPQNPTPPTDPTEPGGEIIGGGVETGRYLVDGITMNDLLPAKNAIFENLGEGRKFGLYVFAILIVILTGIRMVKRSVHADFSGGSGDHLLK